MKPILLEPIQGHIVLYCKGWYKRPNDVNFFEGLKRIWAIRCGWDYELATNDTLIYVANDMFEIMNICLPDRLQHFMENLHREIVWQIGKPENLSPIEALIWEYKSVLSNMEIKTKPEGTEEYITLIQLPEPNKELFERILSGNGYYEDHKLINQ
jgi:hypothetical protein